MYVLTNCVYTYIHITLCIDTYQLSTYIRKHIHKYSLSVHKLISIHTERSLSSFIKTSLKVGIFGLLAYHSVSVFYKI